MDKSLDEYFRDWEAHVFGFGYGTGEQYILPTLKLFLSAVPIKGNYDHEQLEKACGSAIAWFLINALCHADLIEYGTSPRYGWLTEKGKILKNYVDPRTAEQLYETASGHDEDYTHCYPDACNCGPDGYDASRKCANPFWRSTPLSTKTVSS
jgi:hypothetical protein